MVITTLESFSPEEIRPFPKAQPRKTQKGGRRRRKNAISTDTLVKAALEEEANSSKTKKKLQKLVRN